MGRSIQCLLCVVFLQSILSLERPDVDSLSSRIRARFTGLRRFLYPTVRPIDEAM